MWSTVFTAFVVHKVLLYSICCMLIHILSVVIKKLNAGRFLVVLDNECIIALLCKGLRIFMSGFVLCNTFKAGILIGGWTKHYRC